MLMDVYRGERPGIHIDYRRDDQLLNHLRMRFQLRVSTTTVHYLLFADDCALKATSDGNMQRSMDLFAADCDNFVLIINTKNTVVMHQPPPDAAYNAPKINVNDVQLQVVDNFTYLGSTLSRTIKIDDEMARRISKASQAFGRLQNSLESSGSSTRHETEDVPGDHPADSTAWSGELDGVLEAGAVTQSSLTHHSPTDTDAEMAGPDPGHGCTGADGNPQHLRHAETDTITLGPPPRAMDDERLPKRLLYGDVSTGSRRQGGKVRRYKDTLKTSLMRLQINLANWQYLARDRSTWMRAVKTGAAIYDVNRITVAEAKCEARKSQLRPPRNAHAQPAPTCPRRQ
ncbi:hypothetical protein SprV_0401573200 [Sparganum proliferum]